VPLLGVPTERTPAGVSTAHARIGCLAIAPCRVSGVAPPTGCPALSTHSAGCPTGSTVTGCPLLTLRWVSLLLHYCSGVGDRARPEGPLAYESRGAGHSTRSGSGPVPALAGTPAHGTVRGPLASKRATAAERWCPKRTERIRIDPRSLTHRGSHSRKDGTPTERTAQIGTPLLLTSHHTHTLTHYCLPRGCMIRCKSGLWPRSML